MSVTARARRRVHREAIVPDASSSFRLREFHGGFGFHWHYHPEVELVLVVSGRGVRFVADSIEDYADGDLFLVGSEVPHTWHACDDHAGPTHLLVLQFRPEVFGETFLALPEWRAVRALLVRAQRGLSITGAARERVVERLLAMRELAVGGLARVAGLFDILEILACSKDCRPVAAASCALDSSEEARRRINAVFTYVEQRIGDTIRAREVARQLHMSVSAFSRFFKRAVGKPFEAYVTELRISLACRLLLESDAPITLVARQVGFLNQSNFNRRFRLLKGTTPRAYRRLTR